MRRDSPVAQIWILSALTLPYKERVEAMHDIAQMINTTYKMVMSEASQLKAARQAEATAASGFERKAPFTRTAHIPSELRPLTKAQLMAGRAR